ncbi:hypothetical protein [Candidatus Nucleicultrix amoebiphila]|jgi:hypothetical protein|uniref:Uncharacterized protein n=1 Tax=Candidatus Nucleicultrix amoebiphila FS5 TaxID=1414854 RepID=A0A1W6N539_9PROT|nr:hypothetical protein [Candidatus Nucleicultrix amoebiphila]ARN84984.1 hypothetical protein GQ61_06440 [Candidatus Nucleicultrix amoebiphila FS5]
MFNKWILGSLVVLMTIASSTSADAWRYYYGHGSVVVKRPVIVKKPIIVKKSIVVKRPVIEKDIIVK